MGRAKMVIPGDKLSTETLLALLDEAGIPAQHGPEGMSSVKVDMGELTFLIDSYPHQGAIKIWTAQELDPDEVDLAAAVSSANSFNEVFLFVRNFVFQDPADRTNYRVVWDHDRLVAAEGLTADELLLTLTRVADVLMEALAPQEQTGHA